MRLAKPLAKMITGSVRSKSTTFGSDPNITAGAIGRTGVGAGGAVESVRHPRRRYTVGVNTSFKSHCSPQKSRADFRIVRFFFRLLFCVVAKAALYCGWRELPDLRSVNITSS